jgi:hypothetical protein
VERITAAGGGDACRWNHRQAHTKLDRPHETTVLETDRIPPGE